MKNRAQSIKEIKRLVEPYNNRFTEVDSWFYYCVVTSYGSVRPSDREILLENYRLQEKTFDIPEIVFEKFCYSIIDLLEKVANNSLGQDEAYRWILKASQNSRIIFSLSVNDCEEIIKKYGNKEMVKAFSVNPLSFSVGIEPKEISYSYYEKRDSKSSISIGLPFYFLTYLQSCFTDKISKEERIKFVYSHLKPKLKLNHFKNNLTIMTFEANFNHEISHWMNDSLQNFNISSAIKTVKAKKILLNKYYKVSNINFSHMEIDATIHGIKLICEKFSKAEWDNIDFVDLCYLYPNLFNIIVRVFIKDESNNLNDLHNYLINLEKRMMRENLLGYKMDYTQVFTENQWFYEKGKGGDHS